MKKICAAVLAAAMLFCTAYAQTLYYYDDDFGSGWEGSALNAGTSAPPVTLTPVEKTFSKAFDIPYTLEDNAVYKISYSIRADALPADGYDLTFGQALQGLGLASRKTGFAYSSSNGGKLGINTDDGVVLSDFTIEGGTFYTLSQIIKIKNKSAYFDYYANGELLFSDVSYSGFDLGETLNGIQFYTTANDRYTLSLKGFEMEKEMYDMTVSTEKTGNIFFTGESAAFSISIKPKSALGELYTQPAVIQYSVVDELGQTVYKSSENITLPASEAETTTMYYTYTPQSYGIYTLRTTLLLDTQNILGLNETEFSYVRAVVDTSENIYSEDLTSYDGSSLPSAFTWDGTNAITLHTDSDTGRNMFKVVSSGDLKPLKVALPTNITFESGKRYEITYDFKYDADLTDWEQSNKTNIFGLSFTDGTNLDIMRIFWGTPRIHPALGDAAAASGTYVSQQPTVGVSHTMKYVIDLTGDTGTVTYYMDGVQLTNAAEGGSSTYNLPSAYAVKTLTGLSWQLRSSAQEGHTEDGLYLGNFSVDVISPAELNYKMGAQSYLSVSDPDLPELMAKAGIGNVRYAIQYQWTYNPTTGQFSLLDANKEQLARFKKYNLRPLCIFLASDSSEIPGGFPPNTDEGIEAFADYCGKLAAAVSTDEYGVYDFEVWNEWNLVNGKYSGTEYGAEGYFKLLKAVCNKVKETTAGKDTNIVAGAVSGVDKTWIQELLSSGTGNEAINYMNTLSLHPYTMSKDPISGGTYENVKEIRELLDGSVDLIASEIGWPGGYSGYSNITADAQANYIVWAYTMLSEDNLLDKMFVYCFVSTGTNPDEREHWFGMLKSQYADIPYAARPAYLTAAQLNSMLAGAEYASRPATDTDTRAYIYKKGTKSVAVLFSQTEGKTITVDAGVNTLTYYDRYGNAKTITSTDGTYELSIGNAPCYLEGEFGDIKIN